MEDDFQIDDTSPEYLRSRKNFTLPIDVEEDLLNKLEILKKNPDSIVKELKGKYHGIYKVYIGKNRRTHRLLCMINWNKRKVRLLIIKPRNFAYSESV
ncbi:MAG: type II toxin-antitoxin system RelE family toxin [Nitrososphaeraceae archaeon]|jgi:mRNA-degrading endonuclease RelE of RelBE toxin-antitoxin system